IAYQKRFQWTPENPLKILVAKGTYRPAYRATENLVTRYNTFRIPANVQLYGGFDPDQGVRSLTDTRQPADYEATILSGDINGDDTRTGRASTLTLNNYTDNAKHVVMIIGETENAKLQGFKIVGGNATNTYSNNVTL